MFKLKIKGGGRIWKVASVKLTGLRLGSTMEGEWAFEERNNEEVKIVGSMDAFMNNCGE